MKCLECNGKLKCTHVCDEVEKETHTCEGKVFGGEDMIQFCECTCIVYVCNNCRVMGETDEMLPYNYVYNHGRLFYIICPFCISNDEMEGCSCLYIKKKPNECIVMCRLLAYAFPSNGECWISYDEYLQMVDSTLLHDETTFPDGNYYASSTYELTGPDGDDFHVWLCERCKKVGIFGGK